MIAHRPSPADLAGNVAFAVCVVAVLAAIITLAVAWYALLTSEPRMPDEPDEFAATRHTADPTSEEDL